MALSMIPNYYIENNHCEFLQANLETVLISSADHKKLSSEKFPIVINGRLAKLQTYEEVFITYFPIMIAGITFSGRIIKEDLKFTLDHGIKCNKNGKYNGKNLGLVFDKKKNCIHLGKVKGLNGGSTSKSADLLQEKIKDNKNPFVTEELYKVLNSIKLRHKKIVIPSLMSLPNDIKIILSDLLNEFINYSDPVAAIKSFSSTLKIPVMDDYWSLFNLFLELNCIKQLYVSSSRKMIEYIINGEKEGTIIKVILSEKASQEKITEEIIFSEINFRINYFREKYNEIAEDIINDNWNLVSLIKQIIKTRPVPDNGIMANLNKDKKYFINKLFTFQDFESSRILIRDYIKSFNKTGHHIQITFKSEELDIMVNDDNVSITLKNKEDFGIFENIATYDQKADIEISKNSNFLEAGIYKFESLNEKSNIFRRVFSMGKMSNNENFLLTSEKITYKITFEHNSQRVRELGHIVIQNENTKKSIVYSTIRECNKKERILVVSILTKHIPKSKVNQYLKIEECEDKNQRKLEQLKLIKQECATVRDLLIKNDELRNLILDNYIENRLSELSDEILDIEDLEEEKINESLQEIIMRYKDEFEKEMDRKKLLQKLALDANYNVLLSKEKSVNVEQAMKLLSKSKPFVDELKNKELIFLIGGTGSGKSTTACYLLGAKLRIEESRFGDNIIVVEENENDYPKIGQSLGTSETLYAKGYRLEYASQENIMLCDCPGFHDTRGTEYELCTNLSIDNAIKNSLCIRAFILAIPYPTFVINRGREILLEMGNLIDILPSVLTNESLLNSVFLLITKSESNITPHLLLNRASQHIIEINNQIRNSANQFQANETHSYILNIWSLIKKLIERRQVFIIDIADKGEKSKILKKIMSAPKINKSEINSTLLSKEMIREYGKLIEMSTHSWSKIIIPEFIDKIPESLGRSEEDKHKLTQKRSDSKKNRKEMKKNLRSIQEQLEKFENKIKTVDKMIIDLKNGNISKEEVSLFMKTEEENKDHENEINLKNKQSILSSILDNKNRIQNQISEINKEIEVNNKLISKHNAESEEKTLTISKLSKGSEKTILYNYSRKPNDTMFVSMMKAGSSQSALIEVRELTDDDYLERRKDCGLAKDYVGMLYLHVYISKEFRIVPADKHDEFFKTNKYVQSEDRSYCAIIEGQNFKISDQPRASPDGKRMVWPIDIEYVGKEDKIPWVKITHDIPLIHINEATIINLNTDIDVSQKETLRLKKENVLLAENKIKLEEKIKKLENEYKSEEKLFKELQNSKLKGELSMVKKRVETLYSNSKRQIEFLNDQLKSQYEESKELKKDIKKSKSETKTVANRTKYLALLIIKQQKNLESLKDFCYTIIGESQNNTLKNEPPGQVLQNCIEFTTLLSEKYSTLIQNAKAQLDLI